VLVHDDLHRADLRRAALVALREQCPPETSRASRLEIYEILVANHFVVREKFARGHDCWFVGCDPLINHQIESPMELRFILLSIATLLVCELPQVGAATKTWDGSTSASWTAGGNWVGGVAPGNGDGLVFPAGAANLVNTNNSSTVTNFTFVTLTGSNYVLRGAFSLSITNGLTNSPGINRSNHVAIPIAVRANQTWANDVKSILTLASNVTFNGFTVTLKGIGSLACLGNLSGSGATLFKDEAGALELGTGTSSTISNLRVRDGTLEVNGTLAGSLSISNGAALSGSGTVPPFNCAGTVAPSLNGPLTVASGTAVFNASSLFTVNLRGTAIPGTDYAQLKVSSPPNLSGATLSILTLSFIPSLGDTFVVITNTGAAAFSTTFVGKAEGSTQAVNHVEYRISYVGGTGNDVTLTVVGFTASGNTRTWDGGSASSSLWNDALNWSGNVSPAVGDNIVFPSGALRAANTNNFSTNLPVNTLTIGSSGYQIRGAPLLLLGGVVGTLSNGFSTVFATLVLGEPQTFEIPGEGGLSLRSVDNGGNELRVTNILGNSTDIASLVGAGGLTKAGPGNLLLTASNGYGGLTVIESGSINIGRSNALGTATTGTHVQSGGRLIVNTGSSVVHAIAEPLELAGELAIGSGTNVWTGPFTLTGSNAIISVPNGSGSRLRLASPIGGPGGFHKIREGVLELAGTNHTYAGPTIVEEGTLRATNVTLASAVIISNLGTLEASGIIGPLTVAGTNSPRSEFIIATLTVLGPLVALPGAVLDIDIIGSSTDLFDRILVNGSVTLGGQLRLGQAVSGQAGNRLVIIANDGSDPVIGTFAGLPEGAVLVSSNNATAFTISYVGGDGNDVELLQHNPPALLTSVTTITNDSTLLIGDGDKFVTYTVEASSNLVDWIILGLSSANAGGAFSFVDTNAPSFPIRFYRVQSP
jgi:fibronectin-binding autotransporter adhesin